MPEGMRAPDAVHEKDDGLRTVVLSRCPAGPARRPVWDPAHDRRRGAAAHARCRPGRARRHAPRRLRCPGLAGLVGGHGGPEPGGRPAGDALGAAGPAPGGRGRPRPPARVPATQPANGGRGRALGDRGCVRLLHGPVGRRDDVPAPGARRGRPGADRGGPGTGRDRPGQRRGERADRAAARPGRAARRPGGRGAGLDGRVHDPAVRPGPLRHPARHAPGRWRSRSRSPWWQRPSRPR